MHHSTGLILCWNYLYKNNINSRFTNRLLKHVFIAISEVQVPGAYFGHKPWPIFSSYFLISVARKYILAQKSVK